eukprot:314631_1
MAEQSQSNLETELNEYVLTETEKQIHSLKDEISKFKENRAYLINQLKQRQQAEIVKDDTINELKNNLEKIQKAQTDKENWTQVFTQQFDQMKSNKDKEISQLKNEILSLKSQLQFENTQDKFVCSQCSQLCQELCCGHILNKTYASKCFSHDILELRTSPRCPECLHNGKTTLIKQSELETTLDSSTMDKYHKLVPEFESISENVICSCPSINCSFFAFVPRDLVKLNCPWCKNVSCIKCRYAYHPNISCEQHKLIKTDKHRKLKSQIMIDGFIRAMQRVLNQQIIPNEIKRICLQFYFIATSELNRAFICNICLMEYRICEDCYAWSCGHIFHKNCASRSIKFDMYQNHRLPRCPECLCNNKITLIKDYELRLVLDDKTMHEYSLLASIKECNLNTRIFKCPRSNCGYTTKITNTTTICICAKCGYSACVNCKAEHGNETCEQYQQKQIVFVEKLAKKHGWKQCPKCNTCIEKTYGSNDMRCSNERCGCYFCISCGQELDKKNYRYHYSPPNKCRLWDDSALLIDPLSELEEDKNDERKLNINDNIMFNSDIDDNDDPETHIHSGKIVSVTEEQIIVELNDGSKNTYFIDEIEIV